MFDPYYKWLGIRPENQPPDHYRLLGLERFESDRDVIQAAGERQMAHVQSYKIGPQSELSQKILNEIARAKVCLLNPASRAEYDAVLRAASAPVAPPPAAMTRAAAAPVVTPDVVAVTDSARGADSSARLRAQRKPKRKPQSLPLLVVGVCLVLLVGAIASTFLFDLSGAPPRNQAVAPPRVVPKPATSLGEGDRSMERSTATNLPQPSRWPDGTHSASNPLADARQPIPSIEQIQEARSKFKIEGKLTPTVTLDAANKATHPWTRYTLFHMTIELASQANHRSWAEARRCALESARRLTTEFQVPKEFYSAVARQYRDRPPETPTTARDHLARTRPPDRMPTAPSATSSDAAKPVEPKPDVLTIDAPLIDLTKNQTEVKFKPLVNVESRMLILSGLEVTDGGIVRQYPESGRGKLGDAIRVVLRDEPPRAGLEISLHGSDELFVRIKPMIQDPDDVFYPWTPSGFRDVRRRVVRSINAKQEESARAERFVELLTEQLGAATQSKAGTANRKSLQERLEIARIEAADSRNKLQLLERFMANFRELEGLTDRTDRKSKVSFRILRDTNGVEETIVRTFP